MDFFSNIIKNTANKVETLTKSATAAVNSTLSPTSPEEGKSPEEVNPEENGAISELTYSTQGK